jgi:hypothetical protein
MIYALYARIRRALGYVWEPLTDEQINGTACARCGTDLQPRDIEHGWAVPDTTSRRRGLYACTPSCVLVTVEDTKELFRAKVPGSCMWILGLDDVDWDEDGVYPPDQARLDAEPRRVVTITHAGGELTTRPMPASHAEQIVDQALRLRFSAIAAPAEVAR